jgi:hypothetical protein
MSIIAAMRIVCLMLAVGLVGSVVHAAEPATQPSTTAALSRKRPGMSMRDAEQAMGLLGPVRVANYTRTFGPPKGDPHQEFRDRYIYGTPTYYPYYCGWGYPCFGFSGCGFGGFGGFGSGVFTPSGIFYGD